LRSKNSEYKFYVGLKKKINDAMTTELPFIKFTEEDYWEISKKLQYTKATDYKDVLEIESSEKTYKIYEQYCKNPDCGCTEVSIDFVLFHEKEIKEYYFVEYDYVSKQIISQESPLPLGLSENLVGNDNLNKLFSLRNQIIRASFKSFCLEKEISRNYRKIASLSKIARNDKCPCESGRKYKNCCGK
jgi:serine phosphatase RsbU (regulator of sigma subunit)